MKSAMHFLSLFFTILILTSTAYAESPRDQLRQMVEQLQQNPGDDALREKIIKHAQKLKPTPAIPEEAERRMVRGTAAFKGAKSVADYRDAAKEFEQATLAAPWYDDAYLNLGVAQDKAENYEAALRSLKLALLAAPNDKEIKTLIYEVEYRNDKANSPEAQTEKKKRQEQEERRADEEMIRRLDGAEFAGTWASRFLRIRSSHVEYMDRKQEARDCQCDSGVNCNAPIGAEEVCYSTPIVGRVAEDKKGAWWRYEISKDGQEILLRISFDGGRTWQDPQRYVRR